MKHARLATLVVLTALTATALARQPQPFNKPPKEFAALFDGKDLNGWRGRQPNFNPVEEARMPKDALAAKQAEWNAARDLHWKVDTAKGEIVSDGQSPQLATVKDYGDFELYVDWLMVSHNGDSGIYLRGYPQVQIWDPDNPREVANGTPKAVQPWKIPPRQGGSPDRGMEHVQDQDD